MRRVPWCRADVSGASGILCGVPQHAGCGFGDPSAIRNARTTPECLEDQRHFLTGVGPSKVPGNQGRGIRVELLGR